MKKKYITLLLALFNVCLALAACDSEEIANESDMMEETGSMTTGKTLVVYYSYTGTTESVVNTLLQQIEADVVEVEPMEENVAYEANNYAIGSQLIQTIRNNPDDADSYPSIKTTFEGWDDYSCIILATPLWWSSMAAPMQTFLFQYGEQMAGKKVGLIVTSHSSGISGVVSDAKRLIPNAEWFSENLHITSSRLSSAASLIATWLEETDYSSMSTTQTVEGTDMSSATDVPASQTSIYTADGKKLSQSFIDGLPKGFYVVRQTMSNGSVQSKKIKI